MEFAKGVRGKPPPFLINTFKMLEDTETKDMISWNHDGTSLIILDHLQFSAEVLPKYFRHSNFSSFIYQLNNYGFRKIGLRQFEYENRWFQRGQKHLLVNIKRRNDKVLTIKKQRGPKKQQKMAKRTTMEAELKYFEDQINALKAEIAKSKSQMGKFVSNIATCKKNVTRMETKSKELITFLARILGPSLVEKTTQHVEIEPEVESPQPIKKLRLILPQSSESTRKSMDDGAGGKNQDDDQEANNSMMAESNKRADQKLWKKFMGYDSVSEGDDSEQEMLDHHTRIDMAFDDMIVTKILNAKEPNVDVQEEEVTLNLWA